jgi:hypothetical protein
MLSFSGGVASLNRRLMAPTPHGVDAGSYLSDILPKTDPLRSFAIGLQLVHPHVNRCRFARFDFDR